MEIKNVSNQDTEFVTIVNCPSCENRLEEGQPCSCGHRSRASRFSLNFDKRERKTILAYFIFSFILLFSYYQLMNWGPFVLRVPVLKTKQMFGILNSKGFVELAEICNARANTKCVIKTYQDMYRHNKNIEAMAMLAQFEFRNHDSQSAIRDFDSYFRLGGRDPKVPLQYALALEEIHNYDVSIHFLSLSIHQNPSKLALIPTAEMLKIYIAQQKYEQAQRLLENFWSRSDKQHAYFNAEESHIQRYLGPQKTARL